MNVEEYFEVFTGGNSNTLTWTPRVIKDFAADYHEMREREKNKVNNVVLDNVSCCPKCYNPYFHLHKDDSKSCEDCGHKWG